MLNNFNHLFWASPTKESGTNLHDIVVARIAAHTNLLAINLNVIKKLRIV